MLTALLTSVPSNGPPFSCSCSSVAVTLSGDALSFQSGRVGVYTLMQGVTRFDRPVYEMSHPADCAGTNYLHSVKNEYGRAYWFIGPEYTSTAAGLASSWSSDFTCPENASSWRFWNYSSWIFASNGEVVASNVETFSGDGSMMDIACCSAGCEDNFAEARCKGHPISPRGDDGGNSTVDGKAAEKAKGPVFTTFCSSCAVLFVGLCGMVFCCVCSVIRNFIYQKKQAVLMRLVRKDDIICAINGTVVTDEIHSTEVSRSAAGEGVYSIVRGKRLLDWEWPSRTSPPHGWSTSSWPTDWRRRVPLV